jgi:F0F1-type ATP synthase assembly protein I
MTNPNRSTAKGVTVFQSLIKIALTSVLVVAISEAGKRSTLLGSLLASLPLTSLLAFVWLYADTGDTQKVAALSTGIFWLVLPSLILFIALPLLLRANFGFVPALAGSIALTAGGYALMVAILNRAGIDL